MTEPEKVRSAGVRQEDRLLGLDSQQLVQAAKAAKEIQSTYRILALEWVVIGRYETSEEAWGVYSSKYAGRVKDGDGRVIEPNGFSTLHTLEVKLWNVTAEWKHREQAEKHRSELIAAGADEDSVEVVPRNSRREHTLAQYGILKIA